MQVEVNIFTEMNLINIVLSTYILSLYSGKANFEQIQNIDKKNYRSVIELTTLWYWMNVQHVC